MAAKEVRLEGTKEIRDVGSTWSDLTHVMMTLSAWKQAPSNQPFTKRRLWEATLIAYRRCFNTGRRRVNLKALVTRLNESQQASHERFLQLANQHVAHRVDETSELTEVSALLDGLGIGQPVVSVSTLSNPESWAQLKELEEIVVSLRDIVWEEHLAPLVREYVATVEPTGETIRRARAPHGADESHIIFTLYP